MMRTPHAQLVLAMAGRYGSARSIRERASASGGDSESRALSGQPALTRSLTTMW